MPKLSAIKDHLVRRARDSGIDQRADLPKGARVSVRAREGQVWMTFSRCEKPLGDTELATFIAHCAVPSGARRIPAEGQREHTDTEGRTWHQVGYQWAETPHATGVEPDRARPAATEGV
jgi:hypothetical protein